MSISRVIICVPFVDKEVVIYVLVAVCPYRCVCSVWLK